MSLPRRIPIPALCCAFLLTATLLIPLVLQAEPTSTDDWPQVGGPTRDGRSPATGLLLNWPEDGLREVWRQPIGEGFSGISIADGRLFTMASDDEVEYALALDPATGQELWRAPIGPLFINQFGNGPRATPTVEGETVYVLSSGGQLAALSVGDGQRRWFVDLTESLAGEAPRFGYSASVLIEGDLVLVETGGGDGKSLVALDKTTGKARWSSLDGPAAYSSPVVATLAGVKQILFFRRSGPEIVSMLPNGEVFWTYEGLSAVIHMPLIVPPNGVFISSTHDGTGFLVRVRMEDGKPVAEEAWRTNKMKNHFNASVVVGGHIYGFDNAIFKSLDAATGKQNWATRGLGKGSLIEAEGHLVVFSDSGEIALVEVSPEAYLEKGRFQALTGKAWTSPTLAGGRLYLRDQDEIASFDMSRGAAAATPTRVATGGAADQAVSKTPSIKGLTAASVLARYAKARGGAERWRRVESLEMHGTYTSYSIQESFHLTKKKGGLYLFETVMNGGPTVHGVDSGGPWWIDSMMGVRWARRLSGPVARQVTRAAEIESPLIRAEEKGHTVKLVGQGEINGQPTLKLEIMLASGATETWHLDPTTFLEVAIDSKILDGTQGAQLLDERAYFMDFRQVDGLMIAHRVERECVSRHTVLNIEAINFRSKFDDQRFALPIVDAMEVLQPLAGEWQLKIEYRFSERQPWQETNTTSSITSRLDGSLLEEHFSFEGPGGPTRVVRQRSWDRFRESYRFTHIDDSSSHLQVFEGDLKEGLLTASNVGTGTATRVGDVEVLERQVTSEIKGVGFKMEWEQSIDGGETWLMTTRYSYSRPD